MCIRDSCVTTWINLRWRSLRWTSISTVSYTHLDVYKRQAPQAVPTVTVQALGYPQPVSGAAAQYPAPDFSGVPESYAWGPGGVPAGNPPF